MKKMILALILSVAWLPVQPVQLTGTLLVLVPTRDGLLVAADSREGADQSYCDGGTKIVSASSPRTIISVTGTAKLYGASDLKSVSADLCKFLKTHEPLLNFETIVTGYIAVHPSINAAMFVGLQRSVLQAIRNFQRSHPKMILRETPGENGYLSVVLGHFIPDRAVSVLAMFTVCLPTAKAGPEVCQKEWQEVDLKTLSLVHLYGNADFFQTQVFTEEGRQALGQPYLNDFFRFYAHSKPVGNVSADEATKVAVDIIESASRLASLRPKSPAIGGPVRVVLIDYHKRPVQLQ